MHPKTPETFAYLKQCAAQKRIVTYGEVGNAVGLAARGTAFPLYDIRDICLEQDLPPITALVVRKKDRLPGVGLKPGGAQVTKAEMGDMQSQVFTFDWEPIHLHNDN